MESVGSLSPNAGQLPSKPRKVGQLGIRVKGKDVLVPSVQIEGLDVISSGRWVKLAAINDEELVEGNCDTPERFVVDLKQSKLGADIFTFSQKIAETATKFPYHSEMDNWAVIPLTTFSEWWEKQVEPSVRRAVRKAAKSGVEVRVATFDDEFVRGIVQINDETPVRQGRPFWHYQKSFEQVELENMTYADRNLFLGAYFEGELIAFMRITWVGKVAHILQLLPMLKHADKRLGNALIAKAVEVCSERGMTHLVYRNYIYNDPNSSLTEFKRRNGFVRIDIPRYYVPLSPMGRLAIRFGFHRELVKRLPPALVTRLLKIRNDWYSRKARLSEGAL